MSRDLAEITQRILTLVNELDSSAERGVRDRAAELVRDTIELHGAGLARLMSIVREESSASPKLVDRLVADPGVAAVLALHDLLPTSSPSPALVQIERRQERRGHSGSEHCERCGGAVGVEHRHVVDIMTRSLLCTCRDCWTTVRDTRGSSLVAVPERSPSAVRVELSHAQWDRLDIPVGLAFFITNSNSGRTFAFYPSPAGAVESLLPLQAWNDIVAGNPSVSSIAPDVEALILRQPRGSDAFESAVVPVDHCYDLIGRMRLRWTGFDGGDAVRSEIDRFFSRVGTVEPTPSMAGSSA